MMVKLKTRGKRTSTGKIVMTALRNLMENTGWTSRTIAKFIKFEYGISDHNLGRKVNRALNRATRLGLIENESGRYRLSHLIGLVKYGKKTDLRKSNRRKPNRRSVRPRDRLRMRPYSYYRK